MNDIEYITQLNHLLKNYFDNNRTKLANAADISNATISRVLNGKSNISNDFKEKIYNTIKDDNNIPPVVKSTLNPMNNIIPDNNNQHDNINILSSQIQSQILDYVNDNNKTLYDVYQTFYSNVDKFIHSVGAFKNMSDINTNLNEILSDIRHKLTMYALSAKYISFEPTMYDEIISKYAVNNNISILNKDGYIRKTHTIKITITNTPIENYLEIGKSYTFSYFTEPKKIQDFAENDIVLCQYNKMLFIASVQPSTFIKSINLTLPYTKGYDIDNQSLYVTIPQSEFEFENNLDVKIVAMLKH